jgi:hypothetical protein
MMRRFRALSRIGAVSARLPVVDVALLSTYRPAFLAAPSARPPMRCFAWLARVLPTGGSP